ncbi:hypothetical protein [Rhizobium wenxiniae]|uniref:hypothetical protein n=1 Tax=Rhizobium wenxiniae TaxID=1737357 RepID=UPI003C1B7194
MSKAENIELAIYRSGLLRKACKAHHLTIACKTVARHVGRLDRWRTAECNGIERWDAKAGGMFATWTEADQARADKESAESRDAIRQVLKTFIVPGCLWKFYEDPRAGSVARISNKDNTRDCFI